MTIYLLSGTPGSGKSLHLAQMLRQRLDDKRQRYVIGNFRINTGVVRYPENYTYLPNELLSADAIMEWADRIWSEHPEDFGEDRLTLAVDECQLLFNARTWSQRDRMKFVQLFSTHRKLGLMCLLCAQSPKMVDNQFRMLFEYQIDHRKVSTAGLPGAIMAAPFGGRLFARVLYYYQMKERLSTEWYVARKKDMALYDTHERFDYVKDR